MKKLKSIIVLGLLFSMALGPNAWSLNSKGQLSVSVEQDMGKITMRPARPGDNSGGSWHQWPPIQYIASLTNNKKTVHGEPFQQGDLYQVTVLDCEYNLKSQSEVSLAVQVVQRDLGRCPIYWRDNTFINSTITFPVVPGYTPVPKSHYAFVNETPVIVTYKSSAPIPIQVNFTIPAFTGKYGDKQVSEIKKIGDYWYKFQVSPYPNSATDTDESQVVIYISDNKGFTPPDHGPAG